MSELIQLAGQRAMRRLLGWLLALLVAGGLLPASLSAQEETQIACLLRPKAEGLGPRDLSLLDAAVTAALKQHGIPPTSLRERDTILEQEGLGGCYHDTCLDRAGRLLSVQRVVAYRVVAAPATPEPKALDWEPPPAGEHWRRFALSLSYYNVDVGAVGSRVEAVCSTCSTYQAASRLEALLGQAIKEDAGRARSELTVDSQPPGAALFVDGIEVGTTPYHRPAFVGRHELTARKSGFRAKIAMLNLTAGQVGSMRLQLEPGRDAPRTTILLEHQPRPKWRLGLGASLLAVGLGGVGLGAYGFAIDGQCEQQPVSPALVCSTVANGRPAGLGFTIGGGVLAGLGLLFVALPGPRNKLPTTELDRDTFGSLARESTAPERR